MKLALAFFLHEIFMGSARRVGGGFIPLGNALRIMSRDCAARKRH
ncbi:hypothetical protein [Lysobacter gummosus]